MPPGHGEHLRHFIEVVQQRAEPINLPVDMIKILSAIYTSAETGREVVQ
ncbi:hypothetical protein OB236_30785 [Paenibacillus sp. WQ 127069]|uniref:Gfo/Idh/MocA-like oxidoreductase C-terminal domain-containing protein n=1 Tax=Paenibacillus baimaensis TaxID=2982185 RepID=A0ABT2UPE5_9BACL|nr:hypothetical protein [Paenibacillus sp. WQ 127069]